MKERESYDHETKMFVVHSFHNNEILFCGKVKNENTRSKILKAIRLAEDIAFNVTKQRIINILKK